MSARVAAVALMILGVLVALVMVWLVVNQYFIEAIGVTLLEIPIGWYAGGLLHEGVAEREQRRQAGKR